MSLDYETLCKHASKARLSRYLKAADGNSKLAVLYFSENIKIAQSFYPSLHILEVFLRNQIDFVLTDFFKDDDWIINQKQGFMNHKSLSKSNFRIKQHVSKSLRNLKFKGEKPTSDKIIAEQSFSFWTILFDVHYFKLTKGSLLKAFPFKPKNENRSSILKRLNRIRIFRNRVYHNEPICFEKGQFSLQPCDELKIEIFQLLSWISPNASSFLNEFQ